MRYRLALDIGMTSIGWAIFQLKPATAETASSNYRLQPSAIIKAGVRIFNSGRHPKTGSSLAEARRSARLMRRRRDRLLKRKARMLQQLQDLGFFPADEAQRKQLEILNPYALRAKGLQEPLTPAEFARALFHINQRRGFKSNRKTDKGADDSGALKQAISVLRQAIAHYPQTAEGKALASTEFSLLDWVNRQLPETANTLPRTVGELLWQRMQSGLGVRARYREEKTLTESGRNKVEKSYDLYIDRAMIEQEFDALWAKQASYNPQQFTESARLALKDTLLFQRKLRPVKPGRCTLEPEEPRAPLALPSMQRWRIYQEVNHLRIYQSGLDTVALTLEQRNLITQELEQKSKLSFTAIRRLLKLGSQAEFNLEDEKRTELKGNATSAILAKPQLFGANWHCYSLERQENIVDKLLHEESENRLIQWLQEEFGFDEARAQTIADCTLPDGYGSLSRKAIGRILPALQAAVIPYSDAVITAGYSHHSKLGFDFDFDDSEVEQIIDPDTGEITPVFKQLPYYGKPLRRHVAFAKDQPRNDEERYGKIANPTIHIGLNQIRVVVNALIRKYGRPTEVVIELARDLKQSREKKLEEQKRQAENQKRNQRIRTEIARILGIAEDRVSRTDLHKWILWEELNRKDAANRPCPYSGVQISAAMLLSPQVEIEHILPFSQTLDDSLNNKTVAMRQANRIKGNRTPWQAKDDFAKQGWDWASIEQRARLMPSAKGKRFSATGLQDWLKEDSDFLARALNDTRYLARIAVEYLKLVCPGSGVRVIPGQLTAILRGKFGLNELLSGNAEKNRNDHRHHALDACVIGITDQGMLQRFARASQATYEQGQINKLVADMPQPWPNYRAHVARALAHIWVSHKPDHGFEGAMMEATAYGIRKDGSIKQKRNADGTPAGREVRQLIRITEPNQAQRHGLDAQGQARPYIGYIGGNNYCIEITRQDTGQWLGTVISTFDAYQIERQQGLKQLRHPTQGQNGLPLVMRLVAGDTVRMKVKTNKDQEAQEQTMRLVQIAASNGNMTFAPVNEANVDARNRDKDDPFAYTTKLAGSLKTAHGRPVRISATGELRDPGFQP